MIMNLKNPANYILFGLIVSANGVYAQETAPKTRLLAAQQVQKPAINAEHEKLLGEADALVKAGKPADAYALLEPIEFEHSGELRFDYLIGIAALDSGKPDKATLAFERVIAVNPDYFAARIEMARAYFQLGDLPRAKTEFTSALKQNPPETERANIRKYLDAIDEQQEGKRMQASGYIEGSIGKDSNVNSSTSQPNIFVDQYAAMATLEPANVKITDNFYSVAAGGKIDFRLQGNWSLYIGGDLRQRNHGTHTQFDSFNVDVQTGVAFKTKTNRVRLGMLGGQYNLGGSRNSDSTGFKGEWHHVFSPGNQLNAFAQSLQYRYADPLIKQNDIDQQSLGLGWLHVMTGGKSSFSGSVYYGSDQDVSTIISAASPTGGRNDGGRNFSGFRIGGQTALNEKTILFSNAGLQISDYSKVNYYFLRQRNDRLFDLKLGADWHWDKSWTLRPQLGYSRSDSNIAIYGYDRMDVSLTIRRDFR